MFAIAGVLLICAALYVGVPGTIYLDGLTLGQLMLFAGVIPLTWAALNAWRRYVDHFPLVLGLFVAGYFGLYWRDLYGVAGGLAIITLWWFNIWRSKKRRG